MEQSSEETTGWKPIPWPLKILAVVLVLWTVGSAMNLPNLLGNGLPFFDVFVSGTAAFLVVLFFDFIGPFTFLYALWNRKRWAANWAFTYIGLFVLNGVVAFLTVSDQMGAAQILGPTVISLVFIAVIYWQRGYFEQNR